MSLARPLRILAIPGSLRRSSHNLAVVRATVGLAPPGTEITVYDRLAEIPVFNEDLETPAGGPAGVTDLRAAVSTSDALLISTPEYNQSVPGAVKNLIDWLSRGDDSEGLAGRPVAITGATTGPWGTRISQTLLRQMLASTGAVVMPQPMLFIPHVDTLIDSTGEIAEPEIRRRLADLVTALADWTRLHAGARL
jgi:chromate reductase